ncbi:MAG TPA: TylF/MycF/NovP-related O-methyltransferase, partial [Solirubrobacteraceae bacterium]|nr:TylF/MycF/NovP-related O-methyltransferase [Solirubrobacteraceae bacterium]
MATGHYSPFVDEPRWQAAYDAMAADWFTEVRQELRWRMWTLTEHARRVDGLGAFAEFGVYRGGFMFMVLSCTTKSSCHLFDTFAGIPDENLTESEREAGFAGRLDNTSVDYVRRVLGPWEDRTQFHAGDIFEILPTTETGPLAFAHIDLNAALPTVRAIEYAYPRL